MRRLTICPVLLIASLALGCADSEQEVLDETTSVSGKADQAEIAQKPGAPSADLLRDLAPIQTRKKGRLRFVNDALTSPGAADVLLQRLSANSDRSAVRQALAEALPRSAGTWQAAAVDLLGSERDPLVRVELVGTMRRADASQALPGLRLGLADTDPAVRAQAARTTGRHPAGAQLGDELVLALRDSAAEVRASAAHSAGSLRIGAAAAALESLLADDSPDVRLAALRGLTRVDQSRAQSVVATAGLDRDEDERVRRAALRISGS